MHAGLFDVFHDGGDKRLAGYVPHRVDVDLDGVLEELVDQHRPFGRKTSFPPERAGRRHRAHRPLEILSFVSDFHRPSPQHVAGPDQDRVTHGVGDGQCPAQPGGGPTRGLRHAEALAERVPPLSVLGQVDRRRRRPHDQFGRYHRGKLERRLATQSHDHPGEVAVG